MHLVLTDRSPAKAVADFAGGPSLAAFVDATLATRQAEADLFYEQLAPPKATADERHVQRRALAGLLWSKQNYVFDVEKWLDGDNPDMPPPASRQTIVSAHHRHGVRGADPGGQGLISPSWRTAVAPA